MTSRDLEKSNSWPQYARAQYLKKGRFRDSVPKDHQ